MPEPRDRVLVTRPEPGAAATASRIAAIGLVPVVAPMLVIERLETALPAPGNLQAILVASGNALAGIPPGWRAVPLLAVGAATARRARAAGFASVESADGDAAALAALAGLRLDTAGPPLLLASGLGQGERLVNDLVAQGFAVIRREVYAARPPACLPDAAAAALRGECLRAALFFSAETVHAFVQLVRAADLSRHAHGIDAMAIGRAAGVALEALPWRSVRTAATPTLDGMMALLR